MQRRIPDTSKIRNAIGWRPERSLEDVILEPRDRSKPAASRCSPRSAKPARWQCSDPLAR
jgi:hypothetical protein